MNFLAHVYLSQNSPKIQIGNFIADFVKGKQLATFEEGIQKGIRLHRAIDAYTDKHPIVKASTQRLRITQNRYASVAIDIFYDHFLAKNWVLYHQKPLEDFTTDFYTNLQEHFSILPASLAKVAPHIIKENWLYHYQHLSGITKAFEGMSRRASFPSNFLYAPKDLLQDYQSYEEEFKIFFPELVRYVQDFENFAP